MDILARIEPLDSGTGTRPLINLCASGRVDAAGYNSEIWWPAITRKPILSLSLWEPGFTAGRTGSATLEINVATLLKANPAALALRWPGAPVRLYAYQGDASVTLVFKGKVDRFEHRNGKIVIGCSVDERRFQVPVLTSTYLGTGGIEGGADIKGRVKPFALGWPKAVEPVLIDAVNSVYQVSAYGSVQSISACYERAASFGSSFGNYANYAALVAANIPPGRWGTCNAQGLIRLGAPPVGVITADVQGDNSWAGVWRRLPGDIIARILNQAGVWDFADVPSVAGLNVSVPRNMSLYLTQQVTAIDLVREIAGQCNATANISWLGVLFVSRVAFASPAITAEVPAMRRPVALQTTEKDTQGPFWRIEMQAERCWRVHGANEIAFYNEVLDRGDYLGTETYREGNVVQSADGSRWIYINPVPTAGNAPPAWPTASNSFWSSHSPPVGWGQLWDDGAKPADNATRNVDRGAWTSLSNGTAFVVGDEVLDQGSTWGCILAHAKSALNGPPTLPTASNTYWRLRAAAGADGPTGQSNARAWQRSASQPATPADSASTPAGWYDDPADVPAGAGVIWAITGTKAVGATNFVWAAALRDEAVTIVTGDQKKPLGLGTSASLEFKLDSGASRSIEAAWRGTLAAANTLGIDLEWRYEGGSWTAFGSDVPDSGGVGDVVYVTASGSVFNSDSIARNIEVRGTGTRTNGAGAVTTDTSASFIAG